MADRNVFPDSVTALPDQTGLGEHGLMLNAAAPQHRDDDIALFAAPVRDLIPRR
jgi:hypothetical protein